VPSGRKRTLALALVAAAFLVSAPLPAAEGELRAGASAGVGVLSGHGAGPAAEAFGAYGLSDLFDAIVELHDSFHGANGSADVLSASAGLAVKLDVLEWVPHAALLGGYYYYAGSPASHGEHGSEPGASAQIGLDYLLSRELSVGVDARAHASFTDGIHLPLFTATIGAAYRWGF